MEASPPAPAVVAGTRGVPHWLTNAVIAFFVLAGIALRLRQYFFDRSLWGDEAALVHNLINYDTAYLLTHRLDISQSATPAFLTIGRALILLFGTDEWVLRLGPLASGLATVALAPILAKRELRAPAAQILFVALIALAPVLIYYSSEVKQYASDAMVTLCLLTALSYRHARFGAWLVAATGFFGLMLSLPAFLVTAAADVLLLYEAREQGTWRRTILILLAWSAGGALHGLYILAAAPNSMLGFWAKFFAPLPASTDALLWYPRSLAGLAYLLFRQVGQASPWPLPAWSDWLSVTLAIVFLLAIILCFFSRRRLALVATGVLPIALIASALFIYPFSSRLLIYYLPLGFLVVATAADQLGRLGRWAPALVAGLFIAVVAPPTLATALRPFSHSDMRGALQEVRRDIRPDDVIAFTNWTGGAFEYYGPRLGLSKIRTVAFTTDGVAYLLGLVKDGAKRIWMVCPFEAFQVDGLFRELGARSTQVHDWYGPGSHAALFDFTEAADMLSAKVPVGVSKILRRPPATPAAASP